MNQNRLTEEQLKHFIVAAFNKYDKNVDGYLDKDEVKQAMAECFLSVGVQRGVTDENIKQFFKVTDINLDGKVSTTELFSVFQKVLGQLMMTG